MCETSHRQCFCFCFLFAAFLLVQLISCGSNDGEGADSDGAAEEQVREALSSGSLGVQLFRRGSRGRRRTWRHRRSSCDLGDGRPRGPRHPQGQTVPGPEGKQERRVVKSGHAPRRRFAFTFDPSGFCVSQVYVHCGGQERAGVVEQHNHVDNEVSIFLQQLNQRVHRKLEDVWLSPSGSVARSASSSIDVPKRSGCVLVKASRSLESSQLGSDLV